ncbi:MAG: hypothetical protein QM802_20140 [Agriterribacter sp.]
MKKGKWNYTEEIEYTVIEVKLLPINEKIAHWQNAFAGNIQQVVKVIYNRPGQNSYTFWIDNSDGSGLRKIEKGGGPDSYHADIGPFEFIREVPESEWRQWDPLIHQAKTIQVDNWHKENMDPLQYKNLQSLRAMVATVNSGNFHVDEKGRIQPGKKLK